MSKEWSYAKMSQEAAHAGGPEEWIETIKKDSYDSGALEMKNKLVIPLLVVGASLGAACIVGEQKLCRWITKKRKERLIVAQKAAKAEEYLKKEIVECNNESEINKGGNRE